MAASMSQEELLALPVSFDLPTACRALGLGRTLGYNLVKRGEFPCRVLRLGNAYRVTRADLFRALGVEEPDSCPEDSAVARPVARGPVALWPLAQAAHAAGFMTDDQLADAMDVQHRRPESRTFVGRDSESRSRKADH